MRKDRKNRRKRRLGTLMSVMLAASMLGGSVDAGVLAEEIKSEAESSITAETASEMESNKSMEIRNETDSLETPKTESTIEAGETSEIQDNTEETELSQAPTERSTVSSESEDSTVPVTSGTILEILDSDTLSALDPVVIVQNTSENNDALLMRILQLQSVTARVRTADGAETTIRLSVDWNVGRLDLPQIDVSVAGEYEEIGTIVFPDDYTCADGVLRQLRLPVHVVVPNSPIVLTDVDAWTTEGEGYAIATGSDLSDFISMNLPQFWNCYDSSDTLYQADIHWNTDSVSLTTPGLYWLSGTLTAPAHTVFAETLAIPVLRVPISVQDPLKPDINCIFPARGKLYIPITSLPGDPSQVHIWLRRQGDGWMDITDSGDCQILSNAIYLSDNLFTLQETYELQVTYEGGKTGILTFLFDKTMEHFQYSGGDRDGGDSGTGKDDDRVQPAPELPETEPEQSETFPTESNQTETATSEPDSGIGTSDSTGKADTSDRKSSQKSGSVSSGQSLTEHFTSDYDRISGTRLLLTLETSGCAQFSKHGISITIPKTALDALSIACEDFFRITILQPSDDTFSFFFEKNETAIPALPSVQIMLPWAGNDEYGLLLLDEQRHIVSYGSCDPDSHIASFVTDQTGTFLIVPDNGTVSTLVTFIDTFRSSFLQQVSRHPFWFLCL
ncbi:MAG: hypothetical protein PUA72_08165 [Lachnospiraceae bacterium]|nr:hypothetical protein [Lachnospiraceae bacterium]